MFWASNFESVPTYKNTRIRNPEHHIVLNKFKGLSDIYWRHLGSWSASQKMGKYSIKPYTLIVLPPGRTSPVPGCTMAIGSWRRFSERKREELLTHWMTTMTVIIRGIWTSIIIIISQEDKLDIIICDNKKGTCMLINIAISGDRNMIKKEAQNILKYKDLTIEIHRMWNVKTKVIPVTIGATGTISKSFRKYVSNIPGKHEVKELQKTAILGTAHILRKVLI